jgi:hypothetical protein
MLKLIDIAKANREPYKKKPIGALTIARKKSL